MTQSNPGTLQSIYNRARRICADKAQAHLRDFAAKAKAQPRMASRGTRKKRLLDLTCRRSPDVRQ